MKYLPGAIIYHQSLGYGIIISIDRDYATTYFSSEKVSRVLSLAVLPNFDKRDKVKSLTLPDIIKLNLLNGFFDESTIKRAKPYIDLSKFSDISLTQNTFEAEVYGTDWYHVDIKYFNETVNMRCTCPVGWCCKHLYAAIQIAKDLEFLHSHESDTNNSGYLSLFKATLQRGESQLDAYINLIDKIEQENNINDFFDFLNDNDLISPQNYSDAFDAIISSDIIYKRISEALLYYEKEIKSYFLLKYESYRKDILNGIAMDRAYSVFERIHYYFYNKNYEMIGKLLRRDDVYFIYDRLALLMVRKSLSYFDLDDTLIKKLEHLDHGAQWIEAIYNCIKDKELKNKFLFSHFSTLGNGNLAVNDLSMDDLIYVLNESNSFGQKLAIMEGSYDRFLKEGKEKELVNALMSEKAFNLIRDHNRVMSLIRKMPDNACLIQYFTHLMGGNIK